jgi:hypothetical protein
MYIYKITSLLGDINTDVCPPPIVSAIFPKFDGELVYTQEGSVIVEFEKKQTPVDLGKTIKVELIETE